MLAISISQIIDLEVIWAGQQWIGAQTLPMTLVFGLGILAGIGSWNGLGISGLHGSQKVFRLQKNHRKETQENTEYIHLDTHSHTHTYTKNFFHRQVLSKRTEPSWIFCDVLRYSSGSTGPKDLVIVVDVSGSMYTAGRAALAKAATKAVIDTLEWKDT